jgi:hypothetical protein
MPVLSAVVRLSESSAPERRICGCPIKRHWEGRSTRSGCTSRRAR